MKKTEITTVTTRNGGKRRTIKKSDGRGNTEIQIFEKKKGFFSEYGSPKKNNPEKEIQIIAG